MTKKERVMSDAKRIVEIVRERGPQTGAAIAAIGINATRQAACKPLVDQLLEEAGIAA